MRVPYAAPLYGQPEIDAVVRVLENPAQIVPGPHVEAFEAAISALFAKPHGMMVNSGSSANLLALASLGLEPGAEVITPALTFATTVAPILQLGLTPVFVDVPEGSYVVAPEDVEAAITPRTRAMLIPLLLGDVPDMAALADIAYRHDIAFIEDSCDTLGATWAGKPTGAYSDVSTTSFYASHIITAAGGGGVACFRDPEQAKRARLMAYWGRASTLFGYGEPSEDMERRYASRISGHPYDGKFTFDAVGYNMQPLELQAAFGLAQLDRLEEFAAARARNFAYLRGVFYRHRRHFWSPSHDGVTWLAFPVEVKGGSRETFARYLEAAGIQTRPIMTGNILRQPGFRDIARGQFPNADHVMRTGLLLGCHQGLTDEQLACVSNTVDAFVSANRAPWDKGQDREDAA